MKKKYRKQLARSELRRLKIKSEHIFNLINHYLKLDFDRHIYSVKPNDRYRFLVYDVFRQKYKLTVRQALSLAIKSMIRRSRSKRGSLGLPVSWFTTGKGAEANIVKWLPRYFPDSENETMWRQRRKELIIQKRQGTDEFPEAELKSLAECKSFKEYLKMYDTRIRNKRKEWSKSVDTKKNKARAYRDNPFM